MYLFVPAVFFFILISIEFIYFKIADRYNIIDHPNHRSSHTKITIRGGGIIFTIGFLLASVYYGFEYGYFLIGLLLISFISFLDDIKPTGRRIRLLFHLTAVALLFYQLGMYNLSFYWIISGFILVIGTINAVNFMDGINGITGGFGLITLTTLYYVNKNLVSFTDEIYLIICLISLIVFNFFNFRKTAKCFAGDVGSVSLAFIVLFFLLQLILKTNNLTWLLLLLVYGLDTTTTILFRIIRKENIFEAHRSHFYQFLVNDRKKPHLFVAVLYTGIQGMINIILINLIQNSIVKLFITALTLVLIFIIIRITMEGRGKLLKISNSQ